MANLIYRETSSPTLPGASAVKGAPLTNVEVDSNFKALDVDKISTADAVSTNTVDKVVKRDASGNFSANIITVVDLNSTSDRNLKDNITTITDPLSILNQLDGVSFNWKHNNEKSYGIIAQELEKILPELVTEVDGYKMVSYIPLIAFLIEAVKTQQEQINVLSEKVNSNGN